MSSASGRYYSQQDVSAPTQAGKFNSVHSLNNNGIFVKGVNVTPYPLRAGHQQQPQRVTWKNRDFYGDTLHTTVPSYVKNRTVMKVYSLVSIMLLLTVAMSIGLYTSETAQKWVVAHQGVLISSIVMSFVSVIALMCVSRKHPWNIVFLLILNLSISYMVGVTCLSYSPQIVLQAALSTLGATVAATLIAFIFKDKNLSSLGIYRELP